MAVVTTEGGDQLVPAHDRIAVFDNDGTLWTEQPTYAQAFFIFRQIKILARNTPNGKPRSPMPLTCTAI